MLIGVIAAPITLLTVTLIVSTLTALNLLIAAGVGWRMMRRVQVWAQIDWGARAAAHAKHERLRHVVVLPNYREPLAILERTLTRLAEVPCAREQVIIVLAMEGADHDAETTAAALRWRFESAFARIITTMHPPNLPGEIRGKSANLAWAVRQAVELLTADGHALDDLILTTADADSLLHPRYLEALSALYLEHMDRFRAFWQPPIFYHGNLDMVHPLLEPMHAYSSVLQLAFLGQGFAFSTYSLSARLAVEIGYWDAGVIADEQHTFLKAFVHLGGNFRLEPVYLPVAARVVTGRGLFETLINRYRQTIRHAWGAEEVGFAYDRLLFNAHSVPTIKMLALLARIIIDHMLAVGIPLLTVIALPALLIAHPMVWTTHLPQIAALFMVLTMCLLISARLWQIDVCLRPGERRIDAGALAHVISIIALPLIMVLLVTLPALVAHTRLLIGTRPLTFRVSPK